MMLSLLVAAGMTVMAQDKGSWRAASTTADSITGDVAFGNEKFTINLLSYPLAHIRAVTAPEAAAVFSLDAGATGGGNLYRLSIPGAQKFLHKNTLCGNDETDWMVTYTSGHTLQLAFFSGQKMPTMTAEAIPNSTNLCGTYTYTR